MEKKHLLLSVILFIICFANSGCKNNSDAEENQKNVFRYNESAGITSLDPAFASSFENISVVNQIFNGLVQMNNKLEILPCIARSWEISDDGLNYTFHLRTDVYFHDNPVFDNGKGRKVSATDFVHSFYRIINPRISSPGSWVFNDVDFSERSDYSGFVATNDSTLKIILKNPFPPFLGILTMQYCSVVPFEILEVYENEFRNNPVGTGPFKFKTWKEGVKLILVKNDNYFEKDTDGNSLPYLDAISVSFIKERQSEFMEFLTGKFDMISGVDATYKDELLTEDGVLNPIYVDRFMMQSIPFLKTDYIGILVDDKLDRVKASSLHIKKIRQAINYGFNRAEMIKYLRNNIGTPATWGIVPMGMPSFDTIIKGYDYHPDISRRLLEEAGFPNGIGLPEISLSTTSMYQDMSEFIQNQLNELGFKIKIEVLPTAIHMEQTARARLNMFRKSWVADYPDAENYLALFYSKNFCPIGPNYTHFKSDHYDKLYEKAKWVTNDSERFKIYHEMEEIILEESPVVPLYYDQAVRFYSKSISGLVLNPMNLLNIKYIKKID